MIFFSAVILISGKINKTEYSQSVQAIQTQTQQTVDNISDGYYPNNNNFSCSNVAGAVSINGSVNGQGTNAGCVFLGKVIQFGVHGTNRRNVATRLPAYKMRPMAKTLKALPMPTLALTRFLLRTLQPMAYQTCLMAIRQRCKAV